ncbi:MAG: PAS domain S-box protein, partial [Tumebacillaceae bacterium]
MAETQKEQILVSQRNDRLFDIDTNGTVFLENPDAMVLCDRDGICLRVNKMFVELFGYSDDEMLHQPLKHLLTATSTKTQQYEAQLPHKNGHCLDVKVTYLPIVVHGEVQGAYGIFKDMTQGKKTEGELRSTKERMETFFTNSADAIWMIDGEDHVTQANPAFETLFGWAEHEVIGGKLPIIPAPNIKEMEQLHREIRSGRSVIGFETQRICKDGRLISVSATLSPVRDAEGRVTGVIGTCRDISHNKLAEEELRATKELFESIFNYTTDAVIVFDLEGQLLAMNPAASSMSGLRSTDEGNEQLQLQDIITKRVRDKYLDVRNGRASYTEFEVSHTLQDGRQFYLQVTLSPIGNDKGEISALLLMAKDITESKKTQQMLLRSEKLSIAGQLAAGVAHEIRNPLTALKGFVQLMTVDQCYQPKYLEVMSSELCRIEMIVSELLMLAKPQAMILKRKQIVPILQDVMTLSGTQAILYNVQLQSDFADDLPDVDCDDNQLKQVFINFIKNAIEAMPKGGRLRIYACRHGKDTLRIRFVDEGTGIPQEHLSRLGEPFY